MGETTFILAHSFGGSSLRLVCVGSVMVRCRISGPNNAPQQSKLLTHEEWKGTLGLAISFKGRSPRIFMRPTSQRSTAPPRGDALAGKDFGGHHSNHSHWGRGLSISDELI